MRETESVTPLFPLTNDAARNVLGGLQHRESDVRLDPSLLGGREDGSHAAVSRAALHIGSDSESGPFMSDPAGSLLSPEQA